MPWPGPGCGQSGGRHLGNVGHSPQDVDGSQRWESLPERLACGLEKPAPERGGNSRGPAGAPIKAINGADRMASEQRLETLSCSGFLAEPL